MAERSANRWGLLAGACAFALALGLCPGAPADELLRMPARTANNAKLIRVVADEAVEFTDGKYRFTRLLGTVFIDQGGITRVRAEGAVVRLDLQRLASDGVYLLDIYAEGRVQLENGSYHEQGARAVAELSTTSELVYQLKQAAVKQSLAADPFFHRAREAWAPGPAIVQTGAVVPVQGPGQAPEPLPPPADGGFQSLPVGPSVPPAQQPGIFAPPAQPPPPRIIRIAPRTGKRFEMESIADQNAILVTGGIILNISNVDKFGILDVEADNLVIWTRGDSQQFLQKLQSGQGESTRETEFYMSGNVVMRSGIGTEERVLRADQLYYDTGRNVALAVSADVEFRQKGFPDALHFKADEVFQIGPDEFRASHAEVFSSRLPSDPGLTIYMAEAVMSQRRIPRTSIIGRQFFNRETGAPEETTERYFQGESVQVRLANVPVFFSRFVQGTMSDPTGPIHDVSFHHDNIFGYHAGVDLDIFNLLGINAAPGSRWMASVDEFTKRGPGIGSTYEYGGENLFDYPGHYAGLAKLYAMYDTGPDILGGPRSGEPHPKIRGRDFWRHYQELPDGWSVMAQVSYLTDKNFLEQYYKPEFDQGPNQETFAYLQKRREFWGGSLLIEPSIRPWVTETVWLPKLEGDVIGWSPFDLLTYNARGSIGYAQLHPASNPPPIDLNDVRVNTARFDLMQELSLPFFLGPVKVVPFGKMDVAAYTSDINGDPRGRFYVGGGARASLSLSKLYPDIRSDLFNAQGIYHKAVLSGTYYAAWTGVNFSQLPQLDRLNDDATDQSLRDITPLQPALNPANGVALATSPAFNPQVYAIRRLVDTSADTLATIQEFQVDLRQRWQTKRGFPGMQHTVDLLTLDVSATLFPNAGRDNFGSSVGLLEYDAVWNVGDRTAVVSQGWVDPFNFGARFFTAGINLNRPDHTLFDVSFRYADPIQSRLLSVTTGYEFSRKYAMTASTAYDFGYSKGLWNSLNFIRTGTDLQVSVGVNFNPLTNNFGLSFNVLPILVANQPHGPVNPATAGAGRGY